jgi:16S rRNA processing protein RimM
MKKKAFWELSDDVYHTPQQVLALIIINKKEVFVPLHPDFILELNKEKKEIHFSLPEGLLDL